MVDGGVTRSGNEAIRMVMASLVTFQTIKSVAIFNMFTSCDKAVTYFGIGGGVYSFHLPSVTNLDGSFGEVRGALT